MVSMKTSASSWASSASLSSESINSVSRALGPASLLFLFEIDEGLVRTSLLLTLLVN
jgi:hypothetical protein